MLTVSTKAPAFGGASFWGGSFDNTIICMPARPAARMIAGIKTLKSVFLARIGFILVD
jgi:hypothetical protein